ncbi:unnamed protein product [Rhizophagus irregularis]|nr:unnamed protein product [Rhizophagus irregularis]
MARGPHKSKAAKAKSIHRFRTKILKKKRKAVYETGYVEALEKRINILEEKVKNLEEDNVKLLAKRNDAISDLNDKVARIRALEMDQELNARIRPGRKKKNSDY